MKGAYQTDYTYFYEVLYMRLRIANPQRQVALHLPLKMCQNVDIHPYKGRNLILTHHHCKKDMYKYRQTSADLQSAETAY